MGVTAYAGSYVVPVLADPETQANWVLAPALIPATALGAGIYCRKGYRTKGWVLGTYMFGLTVLLP